MIVTIHGSHGSWKCPDFHEYLLKSRKSQEFINSADEMLKPSTCKNRGCSIKYCNLVICVEKSFNLIKLLCSHKNARKNLEHGPRKMITVLEKS